MLVPKLQKRRKPRPKPTMLGVPVPMGELREFVFWRDHHVCAAKQYQAGHVCSGPLTLEHVKGVHYPDDPRQDNERHTVTLCLGLNGISIASHELREHLRARLRGLYPDCERG